MNDRECVALLAWAMPRLGLRWRGFKNLRRQVCRRIARRAVVIGVATAGEYIRRCEDDPGELRHLDALCYVTISRFYRDGATFDLLRHVQLPRLATAAIARGERTLRVWSAGCASGEEPYTIALLWHLELAARFPTLRLDVLATDREVEVLERAMRARYEESSLSELPPELRAFERTDEGQYVLRPEVRAHVRFERHDLRSFVPPDPQDVVLCRNAAFTYFDEPSQRAILDRIRVVPGGILVLGKGEKLPPAWSYQGSHCSQNDPPLTEAIRRKPAQLGPAVFVLHRHT